MVQIPTLLKSMEVLTTDFKEIKICLIGTQNCSIY